MKTTMKIAALAASFMLPSVALAEVGEIKWNGFVSVGGGVTLSSDEEFLGYDDKISFKPDTILALQASVDMSEGLSMTAQLVGRGNDDFDVAFEWAYLSYQFNDELKFDIGKLRVPFYMYSDYLDVAYTYHWLRPPSEVYGSTAINTFEGVSALYSTSMGNWDSSVQVIYGASDTETATGVIEINNLTGISWTMERNWFSARLAYYQAGVGVESDGLTALSNGLIAAGLSNVEDKFSVKEDDDTGTFSAAGIKIDHNGYIAVAEYTQVNLEDSFLATTDQYYISLAKQIDDLTFHITYEHDKDGISGGLVEGIPNVPALAALRAGVSGVVNSVREESDTYTVGLRYDFHPSAAFKIEFSDISRDFGNDASLVSFSIDALF